MKKELKFLQEEMQIQQSNKRNLGYPVLKIRHPIPSVKITEAYRIETVKNKDEKDFIELGRDIEVVFLAERGQYYKYDAALNKITHLTEILPIPRINSSVCLKTGKPIIKLKEEFGKDLTFVNILFGVVRQGKEWKPVVFYAKKSTLKGIIAIKEEVGNIVGNLIKLGLKVEKNGAVVYAVPILKGFSEDLPPDLSPDYLNNLYEEFKSKVLQYNVRDERYEDTDTHTEDTPVDF